MQGPRYFCPAGVELPAHVNPIEPIRIIAGFGPDAAKAGGMHYGGTPDWESVWMDTGEGWWLSIAGVHPSSMMRVDAIRGFAVGEWVVPTLLRADGTAAIGYWSARGFCVPSPYAAVIERLRIVRDDTSYNDMHAALAVDILALNYHVSIHELGEMRALTVEFVTDVLRSASGVPALWARKQDAEIPEHARV